MQKANELLEPFKIIFARGDLVTLEGDDLPDPIKVY